MSKCSFFAGMAAGMVAGAGVCLLIKPMDEADKKRLSRRETAATLFLPAKQI